MKRVKYTPVYERNAASDKKVLINRGGARSSKSHSIAQYLIKRATDEKRVIGICRKTMPALRATAYKMVIELLKEYGRYVPAWHNKSQNTYQYNGGVFHFFSIDDPEKIKSMEFNDVWMEEATEFTSHDFMMLKLRLSSPWQKYRNQMFLSFNPDDEHCWIAEDLIGSEDAEEIVSTYKDNFALSEDYIKMLEATQHEDSNIWRIYGLGQWGRLENVIYKNWETVAEIPEGAKFYGLDFGFNNPSAMVEITEADGLYYLRQVIYEERMTNEDLIARMKELKISQGDEIYADSAEPARIEEISRQGFNVYPADKSVKDGIDFIKRIKLYIDAGSADLLKEIRSYSYKTDKAGNTFDEPVKYSDHCMDSTRYGLYTHLKGRGDVSNWSMVV